MLSAFQNMLYVYTHMLQVSLLNISNWMILIKFVFLEEEFTVSGEYYELLIKPRPW